MLVGKVCSIEIKCSFNRWRIRPRYGRIASLDFVPTNRDEQSFEILASFLVKPGKEEEPRFRGEESHWLLSIHDVYDPLGRKSHFQSCTVLL